MVTKTLDAATLNTSLATNPDEGTDGFFTLYGGKQDPNGVVVKTNGTSDIKNSSESKQHYLSFTIDGAGTLSLTSKTGSKVTRKVCVAEADSASTLDYDVIAMATDYYNSDDSTYTGGSIDCNLPVAGTYYVVSSGSISIETLTVKYDDNNVTEENPSALSVTPEDANVLAPMEWYPEDIATGSKFGNWSIVGDSSYMKLQSDRTISGDASHSLALYLASGDTLQLSASAAGSVTLYAEAQVDFGAVGTFSAAQDGTAIDIASPTYTSSKDDSKTPSSVTFQVTKGTITITSDVSACIFLASYAPVE